VTPDEAARALEAIYSRIPSVPCKRLCSECCGPISMEVIEYAYIFGKQPAPREFEMFGRTPMVINPVTGDCPKLSRDGACMVYDRRPAICRLWGAVKAMACPFGCEPERWLSDNEANAILRQVESLDKVARSIKP